ncbi:transglycosylase SLT domain-containing protein [Sulfitobacter sp. BDSS02]|nr:transglycosylase SLT domain-containing protein [Sulfitobacter sp. BDSS02]MBR9851279.1 lytic transglycosylase domain-containing protein [Paracoccaceae bacterium]
MPRLFKALIVRQIRQARLAFPSLLLLGLGWAVLGITSVSAAIPPDRICDQAAAIAARAHQVPLDVMQAITRTETGRGGKDGLHPWPWTVNMEGAGRWFDNREQARAFAYKHFDRGARSFDVGCFQINYKWHGTAFRTIDEMFDPVLNAKYAARFLKELFSEYGDWTKAAGAYHSRTPHYARIYEARFKRIRAGISGHSDDAILRRYSTFGPPQSLDIQTGLQSGPMFGGGATRMGSLVPLNNTPAPIKNSRFSIFQD